MYKTLSTWDSALPDGRARKSPEECGVSPLTFPRRNFQGEAGWLPVGWRFDGNWS